MTVATDSLPDDAGTLKAMLIAERVRNERLRQIIKELQRHRFGRRAETLPEDQMLLGLEDVEQVAASGEAEIDAANPAERASRTAKRRMNRGSLPAHLPRIEMVVDIDDHTCPCCGNALHRIGEDTGERLDIVPAQFRVLVVRRPKYACRACENVVVQAPAPARLIEGGLPTEATVAQVLVSKYADHLPLYRQAQIYARQGIELDRSTLADWVGRAAFLLRPIHERLLAALKGSTKLFADETTAPVLDPGRGRTKLGQLWAYARDDRPWGGTDPPGVALCLCARSQGAGRRRQGVIVMRTRGIILVIIVLLIIATVFALKLFNPGPTAFAGDRPFRFSIIALPTQPALLPISPMPTLSDAANISRGPPIAWSVTPRQTARNMPADSPFARRSGRSTRLTSRPTRKPALAITPIRIFLTPCSVGCAQTVHVFIPRCRSLPIPI